VEEEQTETVVVRDRGILMVLEEGEYCCVCKTHKNLIAFQLGSVPGHEDSEPLRYTVCNPCFETKTMTAGSLNGLPENLRQRSALIPKNGERIPMARGLK